MNWFNNLSLTWKIVIIVIIIIVIYLIYRSYKNRYVQAKDVVLPPDTQGGNITNWNPGQYTDAIYNDLNDTVSFHSAQPYTDVLGLSNSQTVAIYNDWNDRYKSKFDNKDLISAMEGDFTIWNYSWYTAISTLHNKLKILIPNRH